MHALFTVAQTGLALNPMAACFGFLLLAGVVLAGIAALIAGLLRWRRPEVVPPSIPRLLGVIASSVAILSLSYGFFAFDRVAPAWIMSLSLPALIGGLVALFVSASRRLFFVFAAALSAVILGGGGTAFLRFHAHRQLVRAAERGDTATVLRAIGNGADVESSGDCTLLGLAVGGGHLHTVNALLKAGANPNHWKCSILEIAVRRRDREIVRALLAAGADPEARVDVNMTLADQARRQGSPEIARMLDDAARAR